jgi:hypothetical protein
MENALDGREKISDFGAHNLFKHQKAVMHGCNNVVDTKKS